LRQLFGQGIAAIMLDGLGFFPGRHCRSRAVVGRGAVKDSPSVQFTPCSKATIFSGAKP